MLHGDYHCSSHLPSVSNYSSFMEEAKTIISKNDDADSYLLKLGSYARSPVGIATLQSIFVSYFVLNKIFSAFRAYRDRSRDSE